MWSDPAIFLVSLPHPSLLGISCMVPWLHEGSSTNLAILLTQQMLFLGGLFLVWKQTQRRTVYRVQMAVKGQEMKKEIFYVQNH